MRLQRFEKNDIRLQPNPRGLDFFFQYKRHQNTTKWGGFCGAPRRRVTTLAHRTPGPGTGRGCRGCMWSLAFTPALAKDALEGAGGSRQVSKRGGQSGYWVLEKWLGLRSGGYQAVGGSSGADRSGCCGTDCHAAGWGGRVTPPSLRKPSLPLGLTRCVSAPPRCPSWLFDGRVPSANGVCVWSA